MAERLTDPGVPNPAFAVPTEGENARDYADSPVLAWSPRLAAEIGETPDPMRLAKTQVRAYRPAPADPPADFWLGAHGIGREEVQRHRVEYQDADGFEANLPVRRTWAPNPRATPPPEPRPTSRMSPNTYVFTRPFDQTPARHLNGIHFSMADHRREYPILGMAPVKRRRNTFRAEPVPWDIDLVDMPSPAATDGRPGAVVSYEIPPTRNWRL